MAKVRFRQTAEQDLRDIGFYTEEHWSEAQAELYLTQILDVVAQIAQHPSAGQSAEWLRAGYRRRRAASHLIFYVVTSEGEVEIARVLDERLDVARLLDG